MLAYIDGDIVIYRAACAVEEEHRWPDGIWTYTADENKGIDAVNHLLSKIKEDTGYDEYVICLSDPDSNFRKHIYPQYKSNRTQRKPLLWKFLRQYIIDNHQTAMIKHLEADDVMGILATKNAANTDVVIATADKDLKQIPVPVYNMDRRETRENTQKCCHELHMYQTLVGDTVDGYPGCPGIGDSSAYKILQEPKLLEPYEHTFKSGPRKGLTEERFREVGSCSIWEAVVSQYEKAGLSKEDALVQARCAYILRDGDYTDEGEIRLWGKEYE